MYILNSQMWDDFFDLRDRYAALSRTHEETEARHAL